MSDKTSTSRRDFLGKQAALAALSTAIAPRAHGREPKFTPKANTRVLGANDRINVGFIGNGMQFNALLDRAFHARKKNANDFEYAAVCDVWQPRADYAQKQTGAAKTCRDYREILSRPDIDAVVIAVPDHWHFAIASQALQSGKDVYLEKPMTYTVPEAAKLNDIVNGTKRVLQVGGTGPSTPLYWKINEYIRSGKVGKVVWGLISYNRNTREGMWDYPIPGVGSDHWPDAKVDAGAGGNLDWDMWLGPAPKRKYSHERYFRWRKYWDYSGGNATDLLYHRLGMMSTMIGFDFPTRVVGAGGVYVQKNREVPDTYMTLIEYPGEYAVNMVSCMANQTSVPMTVYAQWGTVQVNEGQMAGNAMGDQRRGDPPPRRGVQTATVRAERQYLKEFRDANDGKTEVTIEAERGKDLVDDWLDCIRSRATPVYNVQRGYQVMVAIALGVESYKTGRVMAFDPGSKRILPAPSKHQEFLPQDA